MVDDDEEYADWLLKKSKAGSDWAMAYAVYKLSGAFTTLANSFDYWVDKTTGGSEPRAEDVSDDNEEG